MTRKNTTEKLSGVVLAHDADEALSLVSEALDAEGIGYVALEKNPRGGAVLRFARAAPDAATLLEDTRKRGR